jgi:hypothetical protein
VTERTPIPNHREKACEVREDHHPPTVDPIRDDAAEEHEHDDGDRPRDSDGPERRRGIGQLVHLPGDRDEVDAVAEERERHRDEEEGEIPDAKRCEDPRG